MSAKDYAHARMREERAAIALHRSLGRSMRIAGCTAFISVTSLTERHEPRFETTWSPGPPVGFTAAEFALFDAFRARAMGELRAELEADWR